VAAATGGVVAGPGVGGIAAAAATEGLTVGVGTFPVAAAAKAGAGTGAPMIADCGAIAGAAACGAGSGVPGSGAPTTVSDPVWELASTGAFTTS